MIPLGSIKAGTIVPHLVACKTHDDAWKAVLVIVSESMEESRVI